MGGEVHLHLGVHKTATTFIQSTFRKNTSVLDRKRVKVLTPENLRPEFSNSLKFLAVRRLENNKLDYLKNYFKLTYLKNYIDECDSGNYKRIVFSDENLIGDCAEPIIYGAVYKTAEIRINLLKKLFSNRRVKVFICLRDYASYLASAYIEVIRHRKFLMFDEYIRRVELDEFRWQKYVELLVNAFPESEVVVWDYAKFRGDENVGRIFDLLAGESISGDFEIDINYLFRKSLSKKALEVLNAVRGILSHAEMKQLTNYLDWRFMEDGTSLKFLPWATWQENFLNKNYRQDLEEIASMKRVTLLFEKNSMPLN